MMSLINKVFGRNQCLDGYIIDVCLKGFKPGETWPRPWERGECFKKGARYLRAGDPNGPWIDDGSRGLYWALRFPKDILHRKGESFDEQRDEEEKVRCTIRGVLEESFDEYKKRKSMEMCPTVIIQGVEYAIKIRDIKTKETKRKLPVGVVWESVPSTCNGYETSWTDHLFVMGTFEGLVHTFRLRFEK